MAGSKGSLVIVITPKPSENFRMDGMLLFYVLPHSTNPNENINKR
jgi:hypothetical protein